MKFEFGRIISLIISMRSDLNQAGVNFLLADLDLATTFLDLAQTSRNEETVRRNHNNARTAYDAVVRLSRNLTPEPAQRRTIDEKLALLKTLLQAVGQQF